MEQLKLDDEMIWEEIQTALLAVFFFMKLKGQFSGRITFGII